MACRRRIVRSFAACLASLAPAIGLIWPVAAATVSNTTITLAGAVTLTLTVTLQPNFTPTAGTCALTLTSSDPHGAVATVSVAATIAAGTVTCAPATAYTFLANDNTGTITITYNVALYDANGQFKNARGAAYLLSASAGNLSPSLTLALTM